MSIATNLRREMICRDINVATLAERSGVSKANISKYLEGKYKPVGEILERLAAGLGCGVADLERNTEKLFKKKENVSVTAAAMMLGINAQTLRVCLQKGIYDFGVATKKSGRFVYDINAAKLYEYIKASKDAVEPLTEYYNQCIGAK